MTKASIQGQTAFITGASSGIGKACAKLLAANGVNVIITARRLDRLQALTKALTSSYGVKVYPIQLDVSKNNEVEAVFQKLEKDKVDVDILVNNAGLALTTDTMQNAKVSNWDIMIDTNLKGFLYVIRAALTGMVKRNKGHIVNIGSVAGHQCYVSGNIYSATKHAVRAISQSLRLDLMGTLLRVSEIDPGAVQTEFSEIRWQDKERAKSFYARFEPLVAEDIADALVYCVTRPPHVNISELIIYPQVQASPSSISYKGEPAVSVFDKK